MERRLFELQIEHRDLDEIVARLAESPRIDELLIKRLKKRKLQLKDQIAKLKSALIPDLDA
ncbi:MAG: YdcH family protein [Candidatus Binatia bacterium]